MAATKQRKQVFLTFLLLSATWVTQTFCRPVDIDVNMLNKHEKWMAQHGRVYQDTKEKAKRYKIFKETAERIEAFNNAPDRGYKLALNQFADLTDDEFRAKYLGFNGQSSKLKPTSKYKSFGYENVTALPSSVDWREAGAVTPVRNQLECASCWAFSAVAAVEGITKLTTGKLISLSEQQLVDCDVGGQSHGCNTGYMDDAFQYIIKNGGITTAENYPYRNADGYCNSTLEADYAAKISGFENVLQNNEAALLYAVANQPVSVAISGSSFAFKNYAGGILSGECDTDLNHAITVVGYGTDTDGTKYWLMKNSWGTSWGEDGYIRMKRDIADPQGLCGLTMSPSYPVA